MEDLELCKRIADIEGLEFSVNSNSVCELQNGSMIRVFNPISDKAILFDLMIKYEVTPDFKCGYFAIGNESGYWNSRYNDKSEMPHAILTVIIEANE